MGITIPPLLACLKSKILLLEMVIYIQSGKGSIVFNFLECVNKELPFILFQVPFNLTTVKTNRSVSVTFSIKGYKAKHTKIFQRKNHFTCFEGQVHMGSIFFNLNRAINSFGHLRFTTFTGNICL